jgi:alkylation response protein AidB-like acyl-CoA dehydrogenase
MSTTPLSWLKTSDVSDAPLEVQQQLSALCELLATSAVARDRSGGHAAAEREAIRRSGLLHLTTPVAFGGGGLGWPLLYRCLRRIAEVDSALAHLFAFHHLQVATVLIYGNAEQQQRLLADTVSHKLFWGNALNPSDRRATAQRVSGGYLIHGPKGYCSGSVGSDRLTLSAWHEATQSFLVAVTATAQPGVHVVADWDAFGQRQTDSGTIDFEQVFIPEQDVLIHPGTDATPWVTLRSQLAQHVLGSLYGGIAAGALRAGLAFTREHARPWPTAGVERSVDDPCTQLRFAELWLQVKAALTVSDDASVQLQAAFSQGPALSAAQRGEVAVAVAEAKVLTHRAAMEVSSRFFEMTGARATGMRLGLDRFWRNARVHTLHDPVDQKLRDLGRFALEGLAPTPTAYS